MELWAELKPSLKREKVAERAARIARYVDWINVPDSPLGRPVAHAIAVAHVAKEVSGVRVAANFRLLDVNWNAFFSLAGAALVLGVDALVLLQGDQPAAGSPVGEVGTEEAVVALKSHEKLQGMRVGVLVSMAKSEAEIRRRLKALPIDLALVTRLSSSEQCTLLQDARRRGVKVVPYVVVSKSSERGEVERLLKGHQRVFTPDEALRFIEELEGAVDGVLVSAPLSFEAMLQVLEKASRRL